MQFATLDFAPVFPSAGDHSYPNLAESNIKYLYVHDDNLGPNVRFRIDEDKSSPNSVVTLNLEAPPSHNGKSQPSSPIDNNYGAFVPTQLIVAANNDISTDLDTLHRAALKHVSDIGDVLNHRADMHNLDKLAFTVASRFFRISEYLGKELQDRLSDSSRSAKKVLSAVRLRLTETVNPMSLHIAVVRIGLDDSTILADFLYDTTDSDRNHPIFAHVAYFEFMAEVIRNLEIAKGERYGVCVRAF